MRYFLLLFFICLLSCSQDEASDPIQNALDSESILIRQVIDSVDQYEVQIRLSVVNRKRDSIIFDEYQYQVDDSVYFYPASTVKFPVAALALEQLQIDERLNLDTPFFVEGDTAFTTMRADIEDIFAVSSNETFNRLFDYLGKDHINSRLRAKGIQPVRISHRLSTANAYDLSTRPLIIQQGDSSLITTEPMINKPIEELSIERILKGLGYYSDDELIEEPMDFTRRNYLPLNTLHSALKRVFFPENFKEAERFNLTDEHMDFLRRSMSLYPKELGYDTEEYYDSYGKFFIYGDSKEPIPAHIKIYNKVGYAYGYLTDSAYIVDENSNVEFILSATIHVNRDGIFNDDQYEYDDIGIPFLAQLGREIHDQLTQY